MQKFEDKAQGKVKKARHEREEGTLPNERNGKIVTGRKQAARWEGGKNKKKNAQAGRAKDSGQE